MSDPLSMTSMYVVFEKPTVNGNISHKIAVGENDDQVSLSMVYEIIQYLKGSSSDDSFKSTLANEIQKGLSSKEKELLASFKEYKDASITVSVVAQKDETSVTEYQAKIGVPTDEYFKDLKYAEEHDFKVRQDNKYLKKMQKISGITPLDELMVDISGTANKPSNITSTDWNKLNSHKLESPYFN